MFNSDPEISEWLLKKMLAERTIARDDIPRKIVQILYFIF